MTERQTPLYWMCKTETGWKRYPAAMGRNGKIRPKYALVGKTQILFETGHYEVRHTTADGQRTWKNVGTDASMAQAAQLHLGKVLKAELTAADAGTTIVQTPGRVNLKTSANDFEDRQIARGKKRSAVTFRTAVNEFIPAVKVQYADQLTEAIINRWYVDLRKNNANRTIYNKHVSIFGWLKWAGVPTPKLAAKAPSFTDKAVQVYKTDEVTKFFQSLTDPYHRIVFSVLLKSGLRMQEAMHLEWRQFDWASGTLTVTERTEDGFTIKDGAERTLPIPATLIAQLKAWQETHGGKLVLGTSNDTPNWKWLPLLKRLARQAGVSCGHCPGCKGKQEECEGWTLKKFRATYITNLLRSGIDPRTVMQYSGHADLATIMLYLAPAGLKETQQKINSITWGD